MSDVIPASRLPRGSYGIVQSIRSGFLASQVQPGMLVGCTEWGRGGNMVFLAHNPANCYAIYADEIMVRPLAPGSSITITYQGPRP